MPFLLSSKNTFDYLVRQGLCTGDRTPVNIELKPAKNFNLLLSLPEERQLLVKQEPHDRTGKTAGEFLREWRIYKFLQQFSELSDLQTWVPEVLHFDADNSILVVNYLTDHRDLADFYTKEDRFPPAIAASLGGMLGTLHRRTFGQAAYQTLFEQDAKSNPSLPTSIAKGLQRVGPDVFGQVPDEGIKFFALYQRFDSLGMAISELCDSFQPCCLTHTDLKLNNILVPIEWENAVEDSWLLNTAVIQAAGSEQIVPLKLIDWERSTWGDPAFDLGMLIASYLGIWLGSLAVSKSIEVEEALRLAMTPLETIQPSLAALGVAYLGHFPEILHHRPDFLQRVVQFSGLSLIQTILSMLQYQKTFGNTGICMLQVAKTLLCRPEQSIATIFGISASELLHLANHPVQAR